MRAAVGLTDGLGIDGDRCIRVIPRQFTCNVFSLLFSIVSMVTERMGDGHIGRPILSVKIDTMLNNNGSLLNNKLKTSHVNKASVNINT